jgi:hypothetical protein
MTQTDIFALLKSSPGKPWTSHQIAKAVGSSPSKVSAKCATLTRFGMIHQQKMAFKRSYQWWYK